MSVSLAANASTSARTGTVTVQGQTFTITQVGAVAPDCSYSVTPPSFTFTSAGGRGTVSVVTSGACRWTVVSDQSWLAPAVTALACLLLWEAAVDFFGVQAYILPPPSDVVRKMFTDYRMFYAQSLPTISAILLGFGLAVAVGVPTATFMVYSPLFRHSVQAILITAQVLPKVALAPLFIVWFGFGMLPKVLMTFLIAFFPIVIDSVAPPVSATIPSSTRPSPGG